MPPVAAGPVGAGAQAATQNLSADIISYSRAKGAYAGVSVDGAVVATRDALNKAYYKKEVTPTDILIKQTVTNKGAAGLCRRWRRRRGSDEVTARQANARRAAVGATRRSTFRRGGRSGKAGPCRGAV